LREPLIFARASGRCDVIHLHHLTPMHDAAARLWHDRTLVTRLHGIELKVLDRVEGVDAVVKRCTGASTRLRPLSSRGEVAPTAACLKRTASCCGGRT
jgi:hypothetical protein